MGKISHSVHRNPSCIERERERSKDDLQDRSERGDAEETHLWKIESLFTDDVNVGGSMPLERFPIRYDQFLSFYRQFLLLLVTRAKLRRIDRS